MTRYILECPDCEARFDLKAYVPEKRVRCRKCRAILSVPFAPGDPAGEKAAPELPPELRRKVSGALSLRRLAVLAAVLLVAVFAGLLVLVQRRAPGAAAVGVGRQRGVGIECRPRAVRHPRAGPRQGLAHRQHPRADRGRSGRELPGRP